MGLQGLQFDEVRNYVMDIGQIVIKKWLCFQNFGVENNKLWLSFFLMYISRKSHSSVMSDKSSSLLLLAVSIVQDVTKTKIQ